MSEDQEINQAMRRKVHERLDAFFSGLAGMGGDPERLRVAFAAARVSISENDPATPNESLAYFVLTILYCRDILSACLGSVEKADQCIDEFRADWDRMGAAS